MPMLSDGSMKLGEFRGSGLISRPAIQAMDGETTMRRMSEADLLAEAEAELAQAIEDRKVIERLVMERKTGAAALHLADYKLQVARQRVERLSGRLAYQVREE